MSFVVTQSAGKVFEKPESGFYLGVLADVVDLGIQSVTFKGITTQKPMVRLIWVLDKNGTDGKPLTVAQRFTVSLHEKAGLYKAVKQILNAPPPPTFDLETLLGQTRNILIQRDKSPDGTKDFANVMGIANADGKTVAVPADFVRDKNKPVDQQAKNKKSQSQVAAPAPQQAQAAVAGKPDVAF